MRWNLRLSYQFLLGMWIIHLSIVSILYMLPTHWLVRSLLIYQTDGCSTIVIVYKKLKMRSNIALNVFHLLPHISSSRHRILASWQEGWVRVREIAHWVKVLTSKPDYLSSIPIIHMAEEIIDPNIFPLTFTCVIVCITHPTITTTYTQ